MVARPQLTAKQMATTLHRLNIPKEDKEPFPMATTAQRRASLFPSLWRPTPADASVERDTVVLLSILVLRTLIMTQYRLEDVEDSSDSVTKEQEAKYVHLLQVFETLFLCGHLLARHDRLLAPYLGHWCPTLVKYYSEATKADATFTRFFQGQLLACATAFVQRRSVDKVVADTTLVPLLADTLYPTVERLPNGRTPNEEVRHAMTKAFDRVLVALRPDRHADLATMGAHYMAVQPVKLEGVHLALLRASPSHIEAAIRAEANNSNTTTEATNEATAATETALAPIQGAATESVRIGPAKTRHVAPAANDLANAEMLETLNKIMDKYKRPEVDVHDPIPARFRERTRMACTEGASTVEVIGDEHVVAELKEMKAGYELMSTAAMHKKTSASLRATLAAWNREHQIIMSSIMVVIVYNFHRFIEHLMSYGCVADWERGIEGRVKGMGQDFVFLLFAVRLNPQVDFEKWFPLMVRTIIEQSPPDVKSTYMAFHEAWTIPMLQWWAAVNQFPEKDDELVDAQSISILFMRLALYLYGGPCEEAAAVTNAVVDNVWNMVGYIKQTAGDLNNPWYFKNKSQVIPGKLLDEAFLAKVVRAAIPKSHVPPAVPVATPPKPEEVNTAWMDEYDSTVRQDKKGSRKGKKGGRFVRARHSRTLRKRKN
jgi:hypothetical protein